MKKLKILFMRKIASIMIFLFAISFFANSQVQVLTDSRDGNIYKSVKIGTQTWMAENLNYKAASGCWCYEEVASNCDQFGRLYNWQTAMKACPTGWHLPTDAEWDIMVAYLGGAGVAGGKLKAVITWDAPNTGADNSSGFRAFSSGVYTGAKFAMKGQRGYWWTATQVNDATAKFKALKPNDATIENGEFDKNLAFPVRCIKD